MFAFGLRIPAAGCAFGATATAATQWPLEVSVDGRFFVQQDGSPYFPIIDTVWMLSYLAQQDVDRYLAHRPQVGFNAVYVSLIGVEKLPQGLNSPNYAGHRPFAGESPTRPTRPDLTPLFSTTSSQRCANSASMI